MSLLRVILPLLGLVTSALTQDVATTAPTIETAPQNTTAPVGGEVLFSCRAVGTPAPNITWLYEDVLPATLLDLDNRVQILEGGDLLIYDIQPSDAGKFSCVASNEDGNATAGAFLHIPAAAPTPELQWTGAIAAGGGYSEDKQQIVSQQCYSGKATTATEPMSDIKLGASTSNRELEKVLGVEVEVSGKYAMFSADAKATYARSIKENGYSLSLNYYTKNTNKITVQLDGMGIKALNPSGESFYNNGNNKYFGLICGDNYIASYDQGAFLTMSIIITFNSAKSKEEFETKVGSSFGDIFSASVKVKTMAEEENLSGTVTLQAFQLGGEPSQLSKVLSSDDDGKFYAVSCSLKAMDDCVKAASGLLKYARDEFTTQISFQENKGLTPLGIGYASYTPMLYLGLTPPESLVTEDVVNHRIELANKLKECWYYLEKLIPFTKKTYPVDLHPEFLKRLEPLIKKVSENREILMQKHGGAAECYDNPDRCGRTKREILSRLNDVSASDLKFLDNIKYMGTCSIPLRVFNETFFSSGEDHKWFKGILNGKCVLKDEEESVRFRGEERNDQLKFNVLTKRKGAKEVLGNGAYRVFEGRIVSGDINIYKGRVYEEKTAYSLTIEKHISPYFFEVYKST